MMFLRLAAPAKYHVMVFRASAAAGQGGGPRVEGVYYLDLLAVDPAEKLLERGDLVPAPNNVFINGNRSLLDEFPSTPRIDPNSNVVTAGSTNR